MKINSADTLEKITACFPVMHELRPHLDLPNFLAAMERMKAEGYRLIYVTDPDVRAVAGFRKMEMLVRGPVLYVDDLVTAAAHRSKGYGRHLLGWLHAEAVEQKCKCLELDSGLQRLDAHRFYEKNGLQKSAFHFTTPADMETRWTS